MHGPDDKQGMMFTTVSPEKRVPKDHPLRRIKMVADTNRIPPVGRLVLETAGVVARR